MIGYLCKAYVTLASIEKDVDRVMKSIALDPDFLDQPLYKAIQRIVSSAIAARTFSTQNAA